MNRREILAFLGSFPLAGAAAARSARYSRSSGEFRAGVTPSDYSYPVGDVRRYGMRPDAHPKANAAALQKSLAANAGGASVIRGPGVEYPLRGRVAAPPGTSIILGDGARLRWLETGPGEARLLRGATRPGIEVQGNDFHLTGVGELVGPSDGAYVANEIGILCVGRSASQPLKGLEVGPGVKLANWGSRGIAAQFVSGIRVTGTTVTRCGYGGMQFLSCREGKVLSNQVGSIGPGASGNAYGISCSHDSLGYAEDPYALEDGRRAANPFCSRFEVASNTVHDIPLWTGIDFHGAYDCSAHDNKVYNCRNGILLQGSSGQAAGFAGENNSVVSNIITTSRMGGGATTVTEVTRLGISVNGGKRVRHRSVKVQGNRIEGYGDSRNTSFSLEHSFTVDLEIEGNTLSGWRGYGCYSAFSQGEILNNEFGSVADPRSTACIFVATGGVLRIVGNREVPRGGRAPLYGVYINSPDDRSCVIRDNDFRAVTALGYAGHGGRPLPRDQMG
jgi:parallel beta-helix repeat protein